MNRKELLSEEFEEQYGQSPESLLDKEVSERELELALRLKKSPGTELALIIEAENMLAQMDEAHLSKESIEELESTRSMLRFNKRVVMAKYGMPWSRIRDLFMVGDYDTLEDNYNEDYDLEDLAKWKDSDE